MPAGRSQARVYPGVNDKFGRGWWDYGVCKPVHVLVSRRRKAEHASACVLVTGADNLMVSWG